jgi:hypothetical protein
VSGFVQVGKKLMIINQFTYPTLQANNTKFSKETEDFSPRASAYFVSFAHGILFPSSAHLPSFMIQLK